MERDDLTLATAALKRWGADKWLIHKILASNSFKSEEKLFRASLLISINSDLEKIFSNSRNRQDFMTMKNDNDYFKGRSPLEIISDGSLSSLEECAKRIKFLSML
ncbi:hypothetical protein KH389_12905 [Pseudomonas qingdaonensis]|uniref:Antitoxin Xre/MbcA/ParS-like toxin-binding domain-containing protein n=1 Tax=Pseudomonas qingdaonensis TaxID=2056231 RepID=A0ABX8DYS0_9PSED|nr:hypothetical protein [Pseudomonas qingdaonensis]QVL21421.1 hypothetical protein KH389_12905 [Pseudomonas qingdaonensis]